MDKRQEKMKKERLLSTVKETPEQRHARVTSGMEPKAHIIPDKRKNKPKHKNKDYDER